MMPETRRLDADGARLVVLLDGVVAADQHGAVGVADDVVGDRPEGMPGADHRGLATPMMMTVAPISSAYAQTVGPGEPIST